MSVKGEGDGTLTGGVAFEAELNASYTGTYEKQSGTTSSSAYANEITVQDSTVGGSTFTTVQPLGTLVLCGMNLSGYSYEMLGSDGHLLPGAPVFTQVWPMDVTITTKPYVMNPNGIIPGQLESYVLTTDENNQLGQLSSMNFADGLNVNTHLTNSWGLSSTTVTSFETYESTSSSNGFSIDFKALVGGGFAGTSGLAGVTGSTAWAWSTGSENRLGVATNVSTRGNINAPNSYTEYSYYTYHLRENPAFSADLLSNSTSGIGLITPTWPPVGSRERQINQQALDTIAFGSAPWKITYVVVDPFWNGSNSLPQSCSAEFSTESFQGKDLPTSIKTKLMNAGVKTPAQMKQLIMQASQQGQKSSRLSNSSAVKTPNGFTQGEAAAIRDYLVAVNDQHIKEYQQKNANRVPRFKTAVEAAKEMQKPK